MEKKDDSRDLSENEVLELLMLIQKENDEIATLKLLDFFEQDILHLARFIRMPREDAIQSMKVELIDLLKRKRKLDN